MTVQYAKILFPSPVYTPDRLKTLQINATAEAVAQCFRAPTAIGGGNITVNRVLVPIGAVGQAPTNGLRVAIQDLDASGDPDGTDDAYRVLASGSISAGYQITGILSDDGSDGGAKKTLTAGAEYAVVVDFESWASGDDITFYGADFDSLSRDFPFSSLFISSWTKQDAWLSFLIEDTSGNWYMVAPAPRTTTELFFSAFNSGTTPDELGFKISLPFTATVIGMWTRWELDNDCDIYLSGDDISDSSVATADDSKTGQFSSLENIQDHFFDDEYVFTAGNDYYLSLRATTGTNSWAYGASFANAATHHADVIEGWLGAGVSYVAVSRSSGGSWTETQGRVHQAGLIIRGIEIPAGGGGGGTKIAGRGGGIAG